MKRGDIVWVSFAPASSQPSHVQAWRRPAIICTVDHQLPAVTTVTVVPGTSNPKALRFPSTFELRPSPENGLVASTTFLGFQVQSVDKRVVSSKLGACSIEEVALLEAALRETLGL